VISAVGCALVLSAFLVSPVHHHWYVAPVYLCGALIGIDAVEWLRGRLDTFSPAGTLAILGLHFFFLAPLLHVSWDYWLPAVPVPRGLDWRDWLGEMASLNVLGIALYLGVKHFLGRRWPVLPAASVWRIHHPRFFYAISFGMLASAVLQTLVYVRLGGIGGYIETFERGIHGDHDTFAGMGALFILSESLPFLAMFGFVVYAQKNKGAQRWAVLVLALLAFVLLRFYFGGLRGSRAHYVYGLFWCVGMIHFFLRPVPKKALALTLIVFIPFMYFYGFYKSYGMKALTVLDAGQCEQMSRQSGRTLRMLILGDFGRSDVQALLLYHYSVSETGHCCRPVWGRTYLGTAALLVPRSIWPGRPPTRVKEGIDAFFGQGTYESGVIRPWNAYGLSGETMLNFGPWAVPPGFALLAALVAWAQRWIYNMHFEDARLLVAPLLISLCFLLPLWDSDVILYYCVSYGLAPCALVTFCSTRVPVQREATHSVPARCGDIPWEEKPVCACCTS
jgi:hypothetical protein